MLLEDLIAAAMNDAFGSFDAFKETFAGAAATRFGSGWAWLGVRDNGSLCICSTANQDNPLMEGSRPLLGLDVWEHAYYIDYRNARPKYMGAFWALVNWEFATANYKSA